MRDIGVELQAQIDIDFENQRSQSIELIEIYKRIDSGTAIQADVVDISKITGAIASQVIRDNLSKITLPNDRMYWNIAEMAIKPIMKKVHKIVNDAAAEVITRERKAFGISIKPIAASFPEERIDSLINNFVEAYNAGAEDEQKRT